MTFSSGWDCASDLWFEGRLPCVFEKHVKFSLPSFLLKIFCFLSMTLANLFWADSSLPAQQKPLFPHHSPAPAGSVSLWTTELACLMKGSREHQNWVQVLQMKRGWRQEGLVGVGSRTYSPFNCSDLGGWLTPDHYLLSSMKGAPWWCLALQCALG